MRFSITTTPFGSRRSQVSGGRFLRSGSRECCRDVVESLEAALWEFDRSSSFEQGALLAVNLGHGADTTGAVFGELAVAFYGEDAIPERWRERVAMREVIEGFADRPFSQASG
jgi:ADP-ribosyl-[dinitrogen reductase] hydrolase